MNRVLRWAALAGLALTASQGLAQDEAPKATDAPEATATEGSETTALETTATEEAPPAAEPQLGTRIGTMEEQVNTLKEQVFRSKATLQLLREIVIAGGTGGARSMVYHVNALGPSYSVESVAYYLDGQSIFAKSDPTGSLDKAKEIQVWDGAIPPGAHNLTVNMVLKGNGFGVFSYVDGYTFKVTSSFAFKAEEGKTTTLKVNVGEDRKKRFEDRPTVNYELAVTDFVEE